ncbi:fumarate and nitrate reduction regulatory protein [Klebsiella michiganensis]|uniref:Fumarate and nitrate reduction regulatory protein n=1 Tax=Klebsiella michiganensis TaxID=1134687 RepID=A0A7H4PLY8_9ENTR|nr:fumarate and nitrate reduction regulatory protein [Klebsiella michiganensis]
MSRSPVFHLAGDLVGFDAIAPPTTPSFAQALETSMVCEIPFETLDDLSGKMPNLRQQMMRLMRRRDQRRSRI